MLDGTGTKLESSPHISMAIEQNDISADQRPLPMKKELPVNSSPNHEKHPQHHQQKDQQLEDKDDDASNTSIRLDKAECLCKDDKILAAASLLEGIDPKFFRPIHRYILHEASLFHRLIENSSSIIEPANKDDDDDDESPENEGQWIKQGTHQRGQRNFAIYYKMDHARSQLTCRIETPIPSSLLVPLLSVLNESELYSKWIPEWKVPKLQVVKSEKLRQSGRCSQIIHVVTVVPWPLAKRELFLKAVACDDIHSKGERRSDGCSCEGFASRDVHRVKNRILIRIQSLDVRDNDYLKEEEEGLQIPPLQNGGVRMEVDGGFVIEKCPSDHPMAKVSTQSTSASDQKDLVLVTFSFTVDPKLPIIPKSFINFFLRTAMGQIWNMFLNVAEDVKVGKRVEHCKEIERKRDLYDWIEERTHVMLSEGSVGGGNGGGNVDGDDDDDFVA